MAAVILYTAKSVGDLSLLSVWSVVEVCVMPVLMHGLENWILNVTTTMLVESFLAVMGKRIRNLPKYSDGLAYYQSKDSG